MMRRAAEHRLRARGGVCGKGKNWQWAEQCERRGLCEDGVWERYLDSMPLDLLQLALQLEVSRLCLCVPRA